jgi:hypothetical protein
MEAYVLFIELQLEVQQKGQLVQVKVAKVEEEHQQRSKTQQDCLT